MVRYLALWTGAMHKKLQLLLSSFGVTLFVCIINLWYMENSTHSKPLLSNYNLIFLNTHDSVCWCRPANRMHVYDDRPQQRQHGVRGDTSGPRAHVVRHHHVGRRPHGRPRERHRGLRGPLVRLLRRIRDGSVYVRVDVNLFNGAITFYFWLVYKLFRFFLLRNLTKYDALYLHILHTFRVTLRSQ